MSREIDLVFPLSGMGGQFEMYAPQVRISVAAWLRSHLCARLKGRCKSSPPEF